MLSAARVDRHSTDPVRSPVEQRQASALRLQDAALGQEHQEPGLEEVVLRVRPRRVGEHDDAGVAEVDRSELEREVCGLPGLAEDLVDLDQVLDRGSGSLREARRSGNVQSRLAD